MGQRRLLVVFHKQTSWGNMEVQGWSQCCASPNSTCSPSSERWFCSWCTGFRVKSGQGQPHPLVLKAAGSASAACNRWNFLVKHPLAFFQTFPLFFFHFRSASTVQFSHVPFSFSLEKKALVICISYNDFREFQDTGSVGVLYRVLYCSLCCNSLKLLQYLCCIYSHFFLRNSSLHWVELLHISAILISRTRDTSLIPGIFAISQ